MTDFYRKLILYRVRVAFFCLFLTFAMSGCSYREGAHQEHEEFMMARNAYLRGNYNLAVVLYRELSSRKIDYKILYADSLRQNKQVDEALIVYNEILAKYPDEVVALHGKSLTLFQSGDSAGALKILLKAMHSYPENFDLFNTTAIIYAYAGDRNRSIKFFKAAINTAGYDAIAFKKVIQSLVSLGNVKTAILLAQKVSKGNRVIVYQKDLDTTLALLYAISGKISKAMRIVRQYSAEQEVSKYKALFKKLSSREFAEDYIKNELKILPERVKSLDVDLSKFIKRLQVNKPSKRVIYHQSNDAYNDS